MSTNNNSNNTTTDGVDDAVMMMRRDEQTMAQVQAIQNDIVASQPLTSMYHSNFDSLLQKYNNNNNNNNTDDTDDTTTTSSSTQQQQSQVFCRQIIWLSHHFKGIRFVRGDGNCFYRAVWYRWLEILHTNAITSSSQPQNPSFAQRALDHVQGKLWPQILQAGFDEMTVETFHDSVVDVLQRLVALTKYQPTENCSSSSTNDGTTKTPGKDCSDWSSFHDELIQETGLSDYATWYLRVCTSSFFKLASQQHGKDSLYVPYLPPHVRGSMDVYCQQSIEPMGKECDELSIVALAECLQIPISIAYVDGRRTIDTRTSSPNDIITDTVMIHRYGPTNTEDTTTNAPCPITLLYRPGHYDILYE